MPFAILASLLLSLAVGPQPPAGWSDGYVLANGIRIHYWRTGGNKPSLVKSGKIVHIKGAGHNVRREGKEETIRILKAFLSAS